ncbi:MAG: DAK2 domain-containing protein [Clostridia bacterium]|nr:DAK2 domain-containing protein [Clostridia bacterium]
MIKLIDGAMLRRMINFGSRYLEINKQMVDALNVFPVPDGDTGSNMFLTIASATREVALVAEDDLLDIASALSKGALKGARGNSGVILSQILKGIYTVLKDNKPFTTKEFARALKSGTEVAYNAVTKPKEGTILTVIRVMAEHAEAVAPKMQDFVEFMRSVINKGDQILAKTPEMLPVLKKAGVVDAGGKGLLCVFAGYLAALEGKEMPEYDESSANESAEMSFSDAPADIHDLEDIQFGYCTEFFVVNLNPKTTEADIDYFREKLLDLGDSVIVIGDLSLVKVHVHTNNPGKAIQYALKLGEVDKVKIENMRQQNRELMAQREAECKPLGMIAVCAGEGLTNIFKDILVDYVIEGGQTMNPSVEDILSAVGKVNAKEVFIFPNNKNIILSAEQAKELTEKPLHIIPTKDVVQGLSAVLAFNPEESVEANIEAMCEAYSCVKSAQITYAVRTTQLDGFDITEGDVIGIFNGKISGKGNSVEDVVKDVLSKMVDEESAILTLYYGEGVSKEQCEKLSDELQEKYPDLEVSFYEGGQPHYYYIMSVE